jgi:hypothetical protein
LRTRITGTDRKALPRLIIGPARAPSGQVSGPIAQEREILIEFETVDGARVLFALFALLVNYVAHTRVVKGAGRRREKIGARLPCAYGFYC